LDSKFQPQRFFQVYIDHIKVTDLNFLNFSNVDKIKCRSKYEYRLGKKKKKKKKKEKKRKKKKKREKKSPRAYSIFSFFVCLFVCLFVWGGGVMPYTFISYEADHPPKAPVRRSLKYGVALCLYLDKSDG